MIYSLILVALTFLVFGFIFGILFSKKCDVCEHQKKALMDEIMYGTGILINGKRVDPSTVYIRGDSKP